MALLEPKVAPLAPDAGAASADAAPDWVAAGTPEPLRSELVALLGRRPGARPSLRPRPLRVRRQPLPPVPEGGGDGPRRRRRREGARVRAPQLDPGHLPRRRHQPQRPGPVRRDPRRRPPPLSRGHGRGRGGPRAGQARDRARRTPTASSPRYGYRLGPDPASTDIACVGGVIANNSGGMRCGVTHDSYRDGQRAHLRARLGDGDRHRRARRRARFADAEPELAAGLLEIRDEILADAELTARIRRKFEIKNTTGYRLCAFLDAETPVEIFRRLLVGSEGTLGFIAEAVFETVPQPPRTTVSWLHFPDVDAAIAPVRDFVAAGARAVELMVAPALIVASHNIRGTPESWRELDPSSAALLVEFGGDDDAGARRRRGARRGGARRPRADPRARVPPRRGARSRSTGRCARACTGWSAGCARPGTALIVEDVCVPPGADGRDGQGPAGAARRARLPARGRRPRLGGEPALHAHPRLLQARGPASATTRSWRG